MSDLEKELLGKFWANEPLREVVRNFINEDFADIPVSKLKIGDLNNQSVGEQVRAVHMAIELFKTSFNNIAKFAPQKENKPKDNPAI